jgi:hypothetical protein
LDNVGELRAVLRVAVGDEAGGPCAVLLLDVKAFQRLKTKPHHFAECGGERDRPRRELVETNAPQTRHRLVNVSSWHKAKQIGNGKSLVFLRRIEGSEGNALFDEQGMGFRALGEGVGREQFYVIAVTLRLNAERSDIGRLKKGGVAVTSLGKRIEFWQVGAGQRKAETG